MRRVTPSRSHKGTRARTSLVIFPAYLFNEGCVGVRLLPGLLKLSSTGEDGTRHRGPRENGDQRQTPADELAEKTGGTAERGTKLGAKSAIVFRRRRLGAVCPLRP